MSFLSSNMFYYKILQSLGPARLDIKMYILLSNFPVPWQHWSWYASQLSEHLVKETLSYHHFSTLLPNFTQIRLWINKYSIMLYIIIYLASDIK